jgi:2-oxoisovalerate ferredoxin oxidoreductase alpha subunit
MAVLDRSYTFGAAGAMFTEVKASVYSCPKRPVMKNYIAGLGGRDITTKIISNILDDMAVAAKRGVVDEVEWVDVAGLPRRWR